LSAARDGDQRERRFAARLDAGELRDERPNDRLAGSGIEKQAHLQAVDQRGHEHQRACGLDRHASDGCVLGQPAQRQGLERARGRFLVAAVEARRVPLVHQLDLDDAVADARDERAGELACAALGDAQQDAVALLIP